MVWRSFELAKRLRAHGHYRVQGPGFAWKTWASVRPVMLTFAVIGLFGTASSVRAMPGPETAAPNRLEQAVRLSARRPPIAHVSFCHRYPAQCDTAADRRAPALRVQDHWNDAMRINFAINRSIRAKPDGRYDSWDIGVYEGDCEDYALQKRADLVAQGWPTDHLRLALVRTARGEPHAVLLVRIGGVDCALDNLTARVRPWDQTGHDYLMVQDRDDPRLWHDIAPRGARAETS